MQTERCEWCEGTKFVTLWHKDYDGSQWVTIEYVDRRTGEVTEKRVPGRVTIFCVECDLGRWQWSKLGEEDRMRLWNTELWQGSPCGYMTTDPTYEPMFKTKEEAIEWFLSRGSPITPLPDDVKTPKKTTAVDVASALYERSRREQATS